MAKDKRKHRNVLTSNKNARTNAVIFIIFGQKVLFSAISNILNIFLFEKKRNKRRIVATKNKHKKSQKTKTKTHNTGCFKK